MSSCQSEPELTQARVVELKESRLKDLSSEVGGQLRAFILPMAMIPGDSIFAPVDAILGIDRRQVVKQALLEIIKILDLKSEDMCDTNE